MNVNGLANYAHTHDAIGNPLTYYNDEAYTFTWTQGRRLATASKGGNNLSFTYNDDGNRTSKTVNGVTHYYTLDGNKILTESWGNELLVYIYDETGSPIGMRYRKSTYGADSFTDFLFEKNLQGDIIAVYDIAGNKLVSYKYNAYGVCFTTVLTTNEYYLPMVTLNPFRYRGYYYDSELEFYYLNSRYYDPYMCRFINADGTYDTNQGILGYNMYTYGLNNPVNMCNPDGKCGRFLGFLWKTDCKKASCPNSKNYIKPKSVDPIGSYNKGRGYVYVVTEDQLEIFKNREKNVVVIVDDRTSSDPNMQILDSHKITQKKQQKEIAKLMLDYNASNPVSPAWSRTLDSLVEEWRVHNFAYSLGYKRKRTGDCDFNNADEGKGFWDFVGR